MTRTPTTMLRTLLRVDRSDYLFTRALIALTGVVAPVLILCLRGWDWVAGNPISLETRFEHSDALGPALPSAPGTTLTPAGLVRVEIADPSTQLRLLGLLTALAVAALLVAGAVMLLRVVQAAQTGRPFVLDSVRCLHGLAGLGFLATFVLPPLQGAYEGAVLNAATDSGEVAVSYVMSAFPLVFALAMLLLAEVFRGGLRMADDVEGLV